ncbi:MAG TPA: NUDIX domain-containing protein [Dehalococcoidia bacterium]|nr:NUDIX domain-containing protein [Dehalococcoidia bacterium]
MTASPEPYPETPSVAGLIVNGQGHVLLQLRDDRPDIGHPGHWGLPGGAVEPGEDPDAAFLREMEEETGWRPERFVRYGSFPVRAGGRPVAHIYAARLDRPAQSLVVGEGQGFAFFPPDALPRPLTPLVDRLLDAFTSSPVYRELTR